MKMSILSLIDLYVKLELDEMRIYFSQKVKKRARKVGFLARAESILKRRRARGRKRIIPV